MNKTENGRWIRERDRNREVGGWNLKARVIYN